MVFVQQKIADFGLAAQLKGADDKHYTMCGTPNYIAPYVTPIPYPPPFPLFHNKTFIILLHLSTVKWQRGVLMGLSLMSGR
jgi:serine/threonine protein kinase